MYINDQITLLSRGLDKRSALYQYNMARSEATINSLDAPAWVKVRFLKFIKRVASELGVVLLAYEGQRTYQRQWDLRTKYLNGGNKASAPGWSWHNFGRAIDLVPVVQKNGKYVALWSSPDWKAIGAIAAKSGIKWGGSFGDRVHFWIPDGTTLAAQRSANPGWEKFQQKESTVGKNKPKDVTESRGKGGNLIWWGLGAIAVVGASVYIYKKRKNGKTSST